MNKEKSLANFGEETIGDWDCVKNCPINLINQQFRITKSKKGKRNPNGKIHGLNSEIYGEFKATPDKISSYQDEGGVNRYFKNFNNLKQQQYPGKLLEYLKNMIKPV